MINFKKCFPDANNFSKHIRLKSLQDWKVEYIKLDKEIGYWIAENPFYDDGLELFKNLISLFPIQKDNSDPENVDPNPFDTIHLPEWIYKDLCFLIRDYYIRILRPNIFDPEIHEWGNIYRKNITKPITCWRIPHVDYHSGMVGNLWFTDHSISESGTKLYRYHGVVHEDVYDFQIDKNHPMHEEWRTMAEFPKRSDSWFNIPDEDLKKWGFEYVGCAPSKINTITMYQAGISHCAYISDSVDFRWSHTFAFSHLTKKNLTMRDILK